MTEDKIKRSVATHDGPFHADEVTACALLLHFNLIDQDKIYRTRDPIIISRCEYVCDVGGFYSPDEKFFDHHQVDYQGELSSAGMILLYLKDKQIIDQNTFKFFHFALIKGVDDHDNGKDIKMPGVCTYSHIIANYNPVPHAAPKEKQEEAFKEALSFALGYITKLYKKFNYILSCRESVKEAMENGKDYLLFEQTLPWIELFFELGGDKHPAKFVIMPSGDHWKLRAIPPSLKDKMNVRHPLPKEWAGLLDEELKKASGILGGIFCHKGRFISVWESRKDAMEALEYTLATKNEER